MDKKMKISIWASVALAAVVGFFALCYFELQIPLFDASGWYTPESGGTMYLDYYGKPVSEWAEVDGKWYFFDERSCRMQTGWVEQDGASYYIKEDGTPYAGWKDTMAGKRYFSPANFAMRTGWADIEGNRYYMSLFGVMQTGWLKAGDYFYYLDPETGIMQTGWLETEEGTYYLDNQGRRSVGWAEVEGQRYFFEQDGTMRTGWLKAEDGTYYLSETGAAHVGWMNLYGQRYYMQEDGKMATGFLTVDGVERYFQESGWYTPVVNRENEVPADYTPNLVEVEGFLVDESCRNALVAMIQAARDEGYEVVINSAYRDEEKQKQVWEDYMIAYQEEGLSFEEAEKLTAAYVAVPGTSEHHLGLAIDFGNRGTIYDWLAENSWRYGFILRYIKDGGEVAYEPWHFRYVGIYMAKEVYESKVILEKYLDTKR